MTYEEQLKDVRWLKKRIEIYTRDNFRCCRCGGTWDLQVHHIHYKKNYKPWEYPNSNLITLCGDCHDKEHHPEKVSLKGDYFLVPLTREHVPIGVDYILPHGCPIFLLKGQDKFPQQFPYLMFTKRFDFEKYIGKDVDLRNVARINIDQFFIVEYVSLPKPFKYGEFVAEDGSELYYATKHLDEPCGEIYKELVKFPPYVYDMGVVSIDQEGVGGWHKGTLLELCSNLHVL